MADYIYGHVTVALPDPMAIAPEAGSLTTDEMRRLAQPRKGIGLICEQVAAILEQNPGFSVPGVDPATLRDAGSKAEGIDTLIVELEQVLRAFQQQNLLYDSAAYELVRRANDQVKAQAKYDPELRTKFAPLVAYFSGA